MFFSRERLVQVCRDVGHFALDATEGGLLRDDRRAVLPRVGLHEQRCEVSDRVSRRQSRERERQLDDLLRVAISEATSAAATAIEGITEALPDEVIIGSNDERHAFHAQE